MFILTQTQRHFKIRLIQGKYSFHVICRYVIIPKKCPVFIHDKYNSHYKNVFIYLGLWKESTYLKS